MTRRLHAASNADRDSRILAQRGGIIGKLLVAFFLLAVLGAVYLLRVPLLRAAGHFWVVEDVLQPSDAIVILGDDDFEAERASRAAELYLARWAPRVVASGRYIRPYASIADLMFRDLTERRVPSDAVVRFPNRASNTREEAIALRRLALEQRWRRLVIVTSNYHTRRARMIFRHIMPPDVDVRMAASTDATYNPDIWWRSRGGVKIFFYESLGSCVALWELARTDESTLPRASEPAASPARP